MEVTVIAGSSASVVLSVIYGIDRILPKRHSCALMLSASNSFSGLALPLSCPRSTASKSGFHTFTGFTNQQRSNRNRRLYVATQKSAFIAAAVIYQRAVA